jgi:eukaryotic-like serine/threonine-protein kinase
MPEADKSGATKSASMSPERWERIKSVLAEVLDVSVSARPEAIRKACRGDSALETEVRELMAQAMGSSIGAFGRTEVTETLDAAESGLLFQPETLVGGRFRLVRLLGRGGMGQVWEAFDTQLHLSVAVKTLRTELFSDSRAVERFQREILTARGVTHPNICRVYDLCLHDAGDRRIPFLTMQLVRGESLAQRLKRGPLTETEALQVLGQCASALDAAHQVGVIHRDFKPANVMLKADDSRQFVAVVMDFGLARSTRNDDDGSITAGGTPGYMPPEQAAGRDVQPSGDVYAFAVVACELLTGKHPFGGGLAALPPRWRRIIRNALDVEPNKRVSSPTALLSAVRKRRARKWFAAGAASALIVASLWTGITFSFHKPPETTIAVLPFEVGEQDPELRYLGEGIAEELINSLTRWPQLRVLARRSSFAFHLGNDLKKTSEALSVKFIVVGSVRRQVGHVRIAVEVVDPKTGFQIWASTFDRPENEIVEIHEIMASEIAQRLGGKENHRAGDRQLQTINPEAHDLYLRGLFHFNHRTREQLLTALDLFQQAIHKAPEYAPLHTALADCYSVLGDYGFKAPLEVFQPAHAAIQQALRLDPDLAEARTSLGLWATLYGWDMELAAKSFRQALILNPGYAPAHSWYSQLLFKTRRFDEADREAKRALQLDPISPAVNLNYGNFLFYSRDYAGLIKQAVRQREIDPALPFATHHKALGLAYLGHEVEAVEAMRTVNPMAGSDPVPIRIWAEIMAVGGDKLGAREGLNRLISLYDERKAPASFVAMIYAALGEPDHACDYLEKAIEERDTNLTLLDVAPPFDTLRKNKRFLALRAKIFKETKARS